MYLRTSYVRTRTCTEAFSFRLEVVSKPLHILATLEVERTWKRKEVARTFLFLKWLISGYRNASNRMDIAISLQRIWEEAVNHFLATCILYPSHFHPVSHLKNPPQQLFLTNAKRNESVRRFALVCFMDYLTIFVKKLTVWFSGTYLHGHL